MGRFSEHITEGREHTERVRLQVVAASHTADTAHAGMSRKQDAFAQKAEALSGMMTGILRSGGGAPPPRATERGGRIFAWASTGAPGEHSCRGH